MTGETIQPGPGGPLAQSEPETFSSEIPEKMQKIFEEASQAIPNLSDDGGKIYLKSTSGLLRLMKHEGVVYIAGASNDYTIQLATQLAGLIKERLGLEAKVF